MQQLSVDLLLRLLSRFWKWIVLFAVLGAVAMGLFTYYFIPKKYSSTATLYIQNGTISSDTISTSNLTAAQEMVTSAKTIFSSDFAISKAVIVLGDESQKSALRRSLSFATSSNSDAILIRTTTTDPLTSAKYCAAMVQVAPEVMKEVFSVAKVQVLDSPSVPVSPSSPNLTRNAIIGGIVGALAVLAFMVFYALLDNRVGNEEDFKQRSEMVVLGEIPTFSSLQKGDVNHA